LRFNAVILKKNLRLEQHVPSIHTMNSKMRENLQNSQVRVKHQVKNSRVPLPAIILTNTQPVRYKLDELHGTYT